MTGDSGADGRHLFPDDPLVLGRRYIAPYAAMEPELCFLLIDTAKPASSEDYVVGYTAGALDTALFYQRMESEWYPKMRALYPTPPSNPAERSKWTPTQNLIWEFHNPNFYFPASLKYFGAHLHIDLVAEAQGKGFGSILIRALLTALRKKGAKAVHLGMSSVNNRALKFYLKEGFIELAHVDDDSNELLAGATQEHTLIMGKTL